MKVIVVGGGLAGLTCARLLMRRGADVRLFEASDSVGGRVRTDRVEGFLLDRGFQVLFTSYPAAGRQLDLDKLQLRRFDPGAIIAKGARRYVLSDPLRDPAAALSSAAAPVVTPLDKLRTALLALELRLQTVDQVLSGPDTTIERYLRRRGFSREYIDNFVRPFYGGILLDRSLTLSAKCFKFDFKMLAEGYAAVPAGGMGEIPQQIAASLFEAGRIALHAPVDSLVKHGNGTVSGVRLQSGEVLDADAVVLSVPAPEAARLSGHRMPKGRTSTVNLYWSGTRRVYEGKKIVLNANPGPFVDYAAQVDNVAPEYAPPGKHLLSATVVGLPTDPDDMLFMRAMNDLHLMFRGDPDALSALGEYMPLKAYRIPYGQFAQPPGIHPHLPDNVSSTPGLFFAAEFTEASSQNAAMISGEKCADAILGPA